MQPGKMGPHVPHYRTYFIPYSAGDIIGGLVKVETVNN